MGPPRSAPLKSSNVPGFNLRTVNAHCIGPSLRSASRRLDRTPGDRASWPDRAGEALVQSLLMASFRLKLPELDAHRVGG